uniref:Pre-mRNA-splicing factor SLU7 n=1 Tax=Babesia bovis TaxID=5865 RepID=S6BPJ4_BABBO|nr:mRNA processing-related protein, putative [Babesia bovis]
MFIMMDTNNSSAVPDSNCVQHTNGPSVEGASTVEKVVTKDETNPYIPRFIAKAPWYLNATSGLSHQSVQQHQKSALDEPVLRGVTSRVAVRYRKNACENCGASTHDVKSCVERPRKKGAKYTNANICPDEYIVENKATGYEAVRDRWSGFDASTHQLVLNAHQVVEDELYRRRMEDLASTLHDTNDKSCSIGNVASDDRSRNTMPNLRIREDTAKYLINLNIDSAFYDPKSRCLRDDPLLGMSNSDHHTFRGDNALFTSGEASRPGEIEQFAWEAQQKGSNVSFMAQPTELEFMFKDSSLKREEAKASKRQSLLDRFGGSAYIRKDGDEDLIDTNLPGFSYD